jgi:pimeloyl-ACP methyl ester carboxylesterase
MAKSKKKQSNPPKTVQVVDPRWLLKMLGLTIAAAFVCAYLAMGAMIYMGSWQLVLHPTRKANGGTGLTSEKLRFGADASGQPQLSGEWIAASAESPRASYAVLYLRGADGQLDAADGTQIAAVRDLGLNVLAFDYRGYGDSALRPHPSQDRMLADAVSAWEYLTGTRHIQPDHVLVFGSGTGVSIGVQLLQNYGPGAGLIAYNADPSVETRVRSDARVLLYPMHLVFRDGFPLDGLKHLATPKLLYTVGTLDKVRTATYQSAADPKLTVEVPSHDAAAERAALARFLDSTLPGGPVPVLAPTTK